MIVDAHLHLWQSDPSYPDQAGTTVSPACDIPLSLLRGYMEEYGVDRAVIVQPVYPGENNQFVIECAQTDPNRFAVVCVVDPTQPGAEKRLAQWSEQTGCRGLRLRPAVQAEEACFGDEATYPLWEFAQQAKVVISLLARQQHLVRIRELAQKFPGVTMIVDHLAHPQSLLPSDCGELLSLADYPNVLLKISGQPYYCNDTYPYPDCHQLVQVIYERFGASRMIWGSDFPHILLQSGYARARYWIERHCPFLSSDELAEVMGLNAVRLYWP